MTEAMTFVGEQQCRKSIGFYSKSDALESKMTESMTFVGDNIVENPLVFTANGCFGGQRP